MNPISPLPKAQIGQRSGPTRSAEALNRPLEAIDAMRRATALAVQPDQPEIGSAVLVKIIGAETGGGKYTGKIVLPAGKVISKTTDLSEEDVGIAYTLSCLVLNTTEVGKNTHDLASSNALPLIYVGFITGMNPDGTMIVVIPGWQYEDCEAAA